MHFLQLMSERQNYKIMSGTGRREHLFNSTALKNLLGQPFFGSTTCQTACKGQCSVEQLMIKGSGVGGLVPEMILACYRRTHLDAQKRRSREELDSISFWSCCFLEAASRAKYTCISCFSAFILCFSLLRERVASQSYPAFLGCLSWMLAVS